MKLKDKKIEILEKVFTHDKYGNCVTSYEPITGAPIWAYFRQLTMRELYGIVTQVEVISLFQITYRDDITTAQVIRYKGDLYEITHIDRYEGYKTDLIIYGKLKK